MTIQEFFTEVEHRDWFHEFSDDHRVYLTGEQQLRALRTEAESDPVKARILKDWTEYHYSGESFGSPRKPKPVLETYL